MTITFDRLKELLRGESLEFLVDPDHPTARLRIKGEHGHYELAVMLQDGGRFLQFRTVDYATCPPDHSHCDAVLRVLCQVNYVHRLVKLAWDPSDGEIVGYADLWIMDGEATQSQFSRMLANFLPAIDRAYRRIEKTLTSGEDPGYERVPRPLPGGDGRDPNGAPPGLDEVLEKLEERAKTREAQPDGGDSVTEI